MTSKRARRANRLNCKKSTGPRTYAGKERSKRNSLKHGFSLATRDPQFETEIEHLSTLISAQRSTEFFVLDAARAVAETVVYLKRIQLYRTDLMQRSEIENIKRFNSDQSASYEFLLKLFAELERLDRYESRALTRRKFAIMKFLSIAN